MFKTGNSKNATPSNASSSIYSLLNKLQNVNNDDFDSDENVKFSLKDPVEKKKDLIAVHNISESNLLKSLDLGGFPMPSIAVMRARQADANADYGDISVVFRKDTIDPEVNRSNKVYGGDAWTPRFPKIEYEIDYDQASNIYSRAHELSKTKAAFTKAVSLHPDNIENSVNRLGIERYIENLKSDYTLKQLYLLEHGGQPVEMQQRKERAEVSEADAQKKSVIDEEIAANACFTVLSNENNFTALVKQNRSLAEKVRDFFADFVEKIKNALTRLAKNNAEYRALQNDTEAKEKILAMFNKALESSQNNSTAKNNSAKYALKEYSQHQIDNWKESKTIVVYENDEQAKIFCEKALEDNSFKKKLYFGAITEDMARKIKQKTRIDVSDLNCCIRADEIRKILKNSHGNEKKRKFKRSACNYYR